MVQVRVVGMPVHDWVVSMPVGVRFRHRPGMMMSMVLVVHVRMLVFQRIVRVLVLVPFREVHQ